MTLAGMTTAVLLRCQSLSRRYSIWDNLLHLLRAYGQLHLFPWKGLHIDTPDTSVKKWELLATGFTCVLLVGWCPFKYDARLTCSLGEHSKSNHMLTRRTLELQRAAHMQLYVYSTNKLNPAFKATNRDSPCQKHKYCFNITEFGSLTVCPEAAQFVNSVTAGITRLKSDVTTFYLTQFIGSVLARDKIYFVMAFVSVSTVTYSAESSVTTRLNTRARGGVSNWKQAPLLLHELNSEPNFAFYHPIPGSLSENRLRSTGSTSITHASQGQY